MVVANISSAKDNLLRAFPESLKELSLILIWRLEATYVTRLNLMSGKKLTECWPPGNQDSSSTEQFVDTS